MYLDAEEEETDDSDDVVVIDNEIVEAQRPRNDFNERGVEEMLLRLSPNRRFTGRSNNLDPDPHIEHQITNLAKVCKLFPDENLETIRGILDACNYDTKIAVTRLNEIKRINEMQGGDTFVPNFVPIDEQKAPKRKIRSPGIETGPQMKQTKSLPESSGVVPKRHTPEEIERRIATILDIFPQANDRAIRHRLEESTDLDTVVTEVLDELGNGEKTEQVPGPSKRPQVKIDRKMEEGPGPSKRPQVKIDRKMEEHLSNEEKENLVHVTQIFPDVDPHFVFEQIAIQRRTLEDIVNRMSNDSSYPKLKQRLEKERQERRRQEFLNSDQFDIEAYLHVFEEPESYFNDQTRNTTDLYTRHAMVHLMNSFRNMRDEFLQRQLRSHNNHLLPTYRTIAEGISQTGADGRRRKPRNFGMPVYNGELREVTPWPEDIDEMFFRELQYLQHEHQIREFIAERNGQREQREHEAKVNGQLIECQCCFIDNKLPEDMIACQQNHAFCRGCIRQHAETQVAQGFHRVTCMSDECSAEHDIRMLQNLLRPVSMDLLLRRRQQDEVRNAQLDNMESCPFCDFAMIIENNEEKVFKCQNPNCLRESCRQCKEPNHIPKRCDEVIKDAETRMRTYVENKMAEAWIRICPKCNKRIIKTSGCNALRCPCGTSICYVCNEELHGPHGGGHFDAGLAFFMGRGRDKNADNKRPCPPYSDMNELHADVAERAGKEARALYLKENPEVEEKTKIDDQHIEQLVDRDANNERREDGVMYRVLMGDEVGERIGEQIGEQLARLGEQFVMRDREVRPGLAGVMEFDVPHIGEAFQVFPRVDGFHRVTCMSDECSAEHDIRMLQNLLRPVSMDLLLRRRQQDEVRNAQLDNMESCPFCDFAMIIENNEEKVFKCQNPNCLRESCRQCKEPNHIPKRCDEVIKDAETRMRTYVENKMAEAWIRICPKCNKRIIKTSGCNALRCPCGTSICYVCNEELHGPHGGGHFDAGLAFFMGRGRDKNADNKRPCPPYSDMNELHADVAERAGKEARALYLKENPEVEEKTKIDDQHIEQLVDRDANNERREDGVMYRVLMGDEVGERIGEQIGEQLARLGEQFVMRDREVRPGLAGVMEFDVPHIGEAFQVFPRVDDAHNHQHPQEIEMRRRALFEHRHADVNRGRERQQADARRRIHEIYRQRRQLRRDIDKYEMQMHRLERATERHNMTLRKPVDHKENNLETIHRSRDEALVNLELLDREQAQAITELNRAREQLNEQEYGQFRVDIDYPVELGPELEEYLERQQRDQNQHLLNEQKVMTDHLRRLHPQLTQVYGEVELLGQLLGHENTDEQRQFFQFHITQNNLVERLDQHLVRDPAQFNEVVERETRELVEEINAHLNGMRQFMSRVSSHPVTKSTEASSSTANSAAASGGNAVTETSIESMPKKMKHLKTLNERIHVLDNQLKDAQRKMNKGMPGGQSVKQLMQQRDDVITDRNGLEAALLRDGIEEQQIRRCNGQYDLTHAENTEAIRLARNVVARREPTHAIQPALRIQFQHGDDQVHIVDGAQRGGAVQVGAGVQIRDPVHLGVEGGRAVHILPGDGGRERLHNRPSLRIVPQQHQQKLVLVPMQNADIRNKQNGKKQSIKHLSNHTTSSSAAASRKQDASSVVDDHSYGKAEKQNAATLEARRQTMIRAQEIREEQMLNEHDHLNQESREIQQKIEELRQREAQVQEQMAMSEQRLAQSREHHFREMDKLNGQVHEMQINLPIQNQEALTAAASGNGPPLQSVKGQGQQIESAWDNPPIHPQKHRGYNGRHAYAGWKDIPEKPWASYNDTRIGRQNVDEPPAQQQQQLSNVFDGGEPTHNHRPVTAINDLPTLRRANLDAWASYPGASSDPPNRRQANLEAWGSYSDASSDPPTLRRAKLDAWASYSGASSDPPNRRQANLDAWATSSGSSRESLALSQGQKNLEAWQKYSDTTHNYAAQRPTNLDAWVPYGVSWNGPPGGPQTQSHGWNTWEPPNTEPVVSLYAPYVPSRSPVSSKNGESTKSCETSGQPKAEGRSCRVPWNLIKLDHGQPSSSRESEQTSTAAVPMETDEPQSTVVLIEEGNRGNRMDSPDTGKAEIQGKDSKKRINAIVDGVKESIQNVERQEVVNALLKVRENMGGNFVIQKLSELVKLVVLELKPVCSVIPSPRSLAKLSNVSTSQSAPPPVIHVDTGDQNQETVVEQQTPAPAHQSDWAVSSSNHCDSGVFDQLEYDRLCQMLAPEPKIPPPGYVCHICYQLGHYINHCPTKAIPQSSPAVNQPVANEQNQGTPASAQSDGTVSSENLLPKIENQNTESTRDSVESDDSTFTMRIGRRDGNLNINIHLPRSQSQESSHSTRNSQENQSIAQSESDQNITDVKFETKTDNDKADFADFGNESQI